MEKEGGEEGSRRSVRMEELDELLLLLFAEEEAEEEEECSD